MELIFSGFEQHFVHEGKPFFAHIYSGSETMPEKFNVGTIQLDASEHSSLRWNVEPAYTYPYILWELDFSIDEEIINDEGRYLALEIAVDYFSKNIWPLFEKKTFGVSLYRGPYKKELLEPLKWLASHLPEEVCVFVFMDTTSISDLRTYFCSINQLTFGPLIPILKGKWSEKYPYAMAALAWDHPFSPLGIFSRQWHSPLSEKHLPVGVLLSENGKFPLLEGDFRMIPEPFLTHEWEGMDYLVVEEACIDERTQRKLAGFCAAGGEVVTSISSLNDGAELQLPGISQPSCPRVLKQTGR